MMRADHERHHVCLRCGPARDFTSNEFNAMRIPPETNLAAQRPRQQQRETREET
jgi:hypothetical protein